MAAAGEKSNKIISKQLRAKANEFLSSRRNSNILIDLLNSFECGGQNNQTAWLLTMELIFTELLKRGDMYQQIVPLKPIEDSPETQYRTWLRRSYEETFNKILECLDQDRGAVQTQALATAMKIIAEETRHPVEPHADRQFPIQKLKLVLMRLLSCDKNNTQLIDKFSEYTGFGDVLFYCWRALPPLTPRTHPTEIFILNYLALVDKLQVPADEPQELLGETEFTWDGAGVRRSLNKAWNCVMHWEHTTTTHRQLLVVLLERVLPHLDRPVALTDFLMDSLDCGGAVGLLALQGVFTLVHQHNLDYPHIFTKLYSMFEPEIFHTKFKARLFYLADLFLSSTHLPETLVAAFAKRLARLSLVAPHEDLPVICAFIGNLLLRHPGLKRLVDAGTGSEQPPPSFSDPYVMEERDPLKSGALASSLWELRTLQQHTLPGVAAAARFISEPLPSTEWDIGRLLDQHSSDVFDKEVRRRAPEIALTFDRPPTRHERVPHYWKLV